MKEYPKLWLEKLRSGEYVQGREALRKDNKYCCLGVLCDITDKEWNFTFGSGGDEELLPLEIVEKYGMICNMGRLPFKDYDGYVVNLYSLNDSGMSFSQLADLIDTFWESL